MKRRHSYWWYYWHTALVLSFIAVSVGFVWYFAVAAPIVLVWIGWAVIVAVVVGFFAFFPWLDQR